MNLTKMCSNFVFSVITCTAVLIGVLAVGHIDCVYNDRCRCVMKLKSTF